MIIWLIFKFLVYLYNVTTIGPGLLSLLMFFSGLETLLEIICMGYFITQIFKKKMYRIFYCTNY